jgi:hypothetical protein
MRTLRAGPAIGAIALVALLAALAASVGIDGVGWLVGITCGAVMTTGVAHGLVGVRCCGAGGERDSAGSTSRAETSTSP